MNKEIDCITNKQKRKKATNKWENNDIFQFYTVYKIKLGQMFFPYLLTCLNKDT